MLWHSVNLLQWENTIKNRMTDCAGLCLQTGTGFKQLRKCNFNLELNSYLFLTNLILSSGKDSQIVGKDV